MDKDQLLGSRGRRLEEVFFSQHNEKLLLELRAQTVKRARREALAKATGITTEAVLDTLIELEVNVEQAAAFALVPLVELAWADGEVQPKEREVILRAAHDRGIEEGSVPFRLLESWLETPPDPKLREVWEEYAEAFGATLTAEQRQSFRHDLLDRARAVAAAAGGFLGMRRISKKEQAMLDQLERVFS